MNQKRFLTLLPLVFISFIVAAILTGFAFYQIDKYGCIGNRDFSDKGLGIEFSIDCKWTISLDTSIENDEYSIKLKHQTAEIEIKKVDDESKIALEEGFRFLELDNGVRRFREQDSSTYYYDALDRISSEEMFQVSATPNEEAIRYIDDIVSSIMN